MNIVVQSSGKRSVRQSLLFAKSKPIMWTRRKSKRTGRFFWRRDGWKLPRGYKLRTLRDNTFNWAGVNDINVLGIRYNSNSAIILASDKTAARYSLGRNNISIPDTVVSRDTNKIKEWLSEGYSLVSRSRKHLQGKNFNVITPDDIDRVEDLVFAGGYVSKFFRKTSEYRVHASRWGVIRLQKKEPKGVIDYDKIQPWNHNASGGFSFKSVEPQKYNSKICKLAMDSLSTLGLDFGAVDILYNDESNEAVITEVNSSPGLKSTSLIDYGVFFSWLNSHGNIVPPNLYYDSDTKSSQFYYNDESVYYKNKEKGKGIDWEAFELTFKRPTSTIGVTL